MKKLLPILLLVFASSVIGQIEAPKKFHVKYDKFKDKTRVAFSGTEYTSFIASFTFDGETLTADQQDFYLYFHGNCPGFCFNRASLLLLIDGERVAVGHDRGLSDSVLFSMPRKLLERIASAEVVEYQVGSFEGTWQGVSIERFKTLLELGTVKK